MAVQSKSDAIEKVIASPDFIVQNRERRRREKAAREEKSGAEIQKVKNRFIGPGSSKQDRICGHSEVSPQKKVCVI
jgi:hypothetical protein